MPPSDVMVPDAELSVVRKSLPHDSAPRHVTGSAAYIDDIREPAGTLHIAPGYAPIAAGKITALDLDAVRTAPGVVAVMTADDIPGANDVSPKLLGDDPALAGDTIRFHGQVVFIVIAKTRDQARRATKKAKFTTVAETPIIDVDDATDLVLPDYAFIQGDPEAAIATAPRIFEDSFRVGGQEHFYLEGQIAMAVPGEAGEMLVYSSTQHPSEVQHLVSHALHVPSSAVTVEIRRMGGGFGGKESQASQWAVLAALAAAKTKRPCKMRLDRDDDMIMTGKRHDFRVDYRVGYDDEGLLQGVDVTFNARCGHSEDLSMGVVDRTMFHADNSYFYPQSRVLARRLRTNTCSNTAFRGFGGPQGMVFAERMMDQIAYRLGKDPLDVRKANFYRDGSRDRTPYGMQVTDNLLHELVAELETKCDYRARRAEITAWNAQSRILKRGLALTPIKFGISFTLMMLNQAGALVHLYRDGSLHLNHGGTEMGQGLFLKVAQVVAEEFGVDMGKVAITATRTDKVPNTSPTAASSGTDLNAMAALNACKIIKDRLFAFIEEKWQVPRSQVKFRDNQVLLGNRVMSLGELANAAYVDRVQLSSAGFYKTPTIAWDRDKAEGRPFFYFAYGASCTEVTIDTMTGEMKVDRIDVLHDVGKSLNPAIDIGQIEGGFVQGMGWLTTEELVWDKQGRLRTHAPSTYKIPAASDIPEHFKVELFESDGARVDTIYRSKAVGEPPLMLPISVFCAINNAVASVNPGTVPMLDAPATPEAIMKAVRAMTAGAD
ncbi:xanthine dehydrogenase molybdopterin binding subunit [Kaistia dalseonensis]|uniref:Xanthine dehydrogenase large subunit n=1 Tax=Kaistia dalseonensis TaxID=410840 RepID=A0ABU0H2P1_9HYPH|nr:xanthine dehydrogenase molybdopterin binding subunit [Kaistia dalseonensis]MCX5493971.1 xanthine dehydrogenase molybdopterin binding subunit [Kaistia dalseonensis]MDQ0436547.1 xanthine dehydrogenase large subunit [Kaistia dalseonensis]